MERQKYAQLAAVALIAPSAHELFRVVAGRPWQGFVPSFSHGLSVVLALWWLAAALALLLRRSGVHVATASWVLGITGAVWLGIHTVDLFVVKALGWALLYAADAAFLVFCLKRSFDRGLLRHGHELDPRRI
jgi:hypothetical protein